MTILRVKKFGDAFEVSWPTDHKEASNIQGWLNNVSPGYVEWLLQFGKDPHCSNCRDIECENVGNGDDACPAFKWGEEW